ncbi:MAG: 3-methyl-2-oxobutanoate hydroxymethyltransferase [Tepidisphaeraceae bacterium]|jgi:3-methyl-2-oxobutanoate hydroxymethyltransferase
MTQSLAKKFTLADLRTARQSGQKVPMLTCYDFSMARLMQEAGVPALLVGDSAANVILGHSTTLPISLDFLIELTAAVRRGAPNCLVMADMPFGSYQASTAQGTANVMRMVQLSGCDCVKIEVAAAHARLVARLADGGVAVMAHLGLRPQSIGLLGGYQARGRTADEAQKIVRLAQRMQRAGAAAILLEAVPPQVSAAVVEAVELPVIGCGAGPACHAQVIVTHDAIGWTAGGRVPKFVPQLGDMATPLRECFAQYVRLVSQGVYPAAEHCYEMPEKEKAALTRSRQAAKD